MDGDGRSWAGMGHADGSGQGALICVAEGDEHGLGYGVGDAQTYGTTRGEGDGCGDDSCLTPSSGRGVSLGEIIQEEDHSFGGGYAVASGTVGGGSGA